MKRKAIRKTILIVIISLFSVLIMSFMLWTTLLSYPNLSYSNETKFGQVTVFHNLELEDKTGEIIADAIEIVKSSELYDENKNINLCLNDDRIYPNLYPIDETPAYTLSNVVILKKGDYNFNKNLVVMHWEKNGVYQKMDLTWILAHEFTHCMQNNANFDYIKSTTKGQINWKLEGHAEYISKKFKNDGRLKEKIDDYLVKSQNGEDLVRVTVDKNGKKLTHSYYKYSLLVQYLMEIMDMDYFEICKLETNSDQVYSEMIKWRNK